MGEWKRKYVAKLKHRRKRQKRELWRKLARLLLSERATLERVQREFPHAVHGVLKTVAWISQEEGVEIPHHLGRPVLEVVSPASLVAPELVPPPVKIAPPPKPTEPAPEKAKPRRTTRQAAAKAPEPEEKPTPARKTTRSRKGKPSSQTSSESSGG